MSHYLIKQGLNVIHIDKLHKTYYKFLKIKTIFHSFNKKKYLRLRDPFLVKRITKQIQKQIDIINPDIVFSQGSLEVSLLGCKQPIVIWCDGNFADLIDRHPHYCNLSDKTIKDSLMLEKKAYDRAALLIFPSEWAAQSTIEKYSVNPSKVHVVPYGANIDYDMDEEEIKQKILSRPSDIIKILFSGVDWYYKGGDVLLEAVNILIRNGFKVELNIVGCNPSPDEDILKYTKVHGFLRKSIESERNLLQQLYLDSHYFVLPTRYETYGISFCEANAYGLPALGTNTGGVQSIITNGINGFLIEGINAPQFIAEKIIRLFTNYNEYINLALSSFNEYKTRLNWDAACSKVKNLLQQINVIK